MRSDVARIEGRAGEGADVVGRLAARPDGGGAYGDLVEVWREHLGCGGEQVR